MDKRNCNGGTLTLVLAMLVFVTDAHSFRCEPEISVSELNRQFELAESELLPDACALEHRLRDTFPPGIEFSKFLRATESLRRFSGFGWKVEFESISNDRFQVIMFTRVLLENDHDFAYILELKAGFDDFSVLSNWSAEYIVAPTGDLAPKSLPLPE